MRVRANAFLARLAKAIRMLVSSSFKPLTLLLTVKTRIWPLSIVGLQPDEGRRKPPSRLDIAFW